MELMPLVIFAKKWEMKVTMDGIYYFKNVCGWEISGREHSKGKETSQYLLPSDFYIRRFTYSWSFWFPLCSLPLFLSSTDDLTDLAEESKAVGI